MVLTTLMQLSFFCGVVIVDAPATVFAAAAAAVPLVLIFRVFWKSLEVLY